MCLALALQPLWCCESREHGVSESAAHTEQEEGWTHWPKRPVKGTQVKDREIQIKTLCSSLFTTELWVQYLFIWTLSLFIDSDLFSALSLLFSILLLHSLPPFNSASSLLSCFPLCWRSISLTPNPSCFLPDREPISTTRKAPVSRPLGGSRLTCTSVLDSDLCSSYCMRHLHQRPDLHKGKQHHS